jgi:type IV pilus assembly protein PilP
MSLKFMTPTHAQNPPAPSSGDLPPEFAQEAQKIPPPPSQPPGAQENPPPPPPPSVQPDTAVPQSMPVPPPGTVEAPVVPQFASDEQYNYDPTGRRDPFKPYKTYRPAPVVTSTSPGGVVTKVVDESDPLQRWDLDRFAVVAIMWEVRQPKAMVKDPDGKMFLIGKNTKIGRNSGHVVTIREGEVVVVELIENEGVQTKEVKVLELKK